MSEEQNEPKIIQMNPVVQDGLKPMLPISKNTICSHVNITVDVDEREIRCDKCDSIVEPWDYVLSLARQERMYFQNLAAVKKEVKDMYQTKEQLQKEVANLKATKRRLA